MLPWMAKAADLFAVEVLADVTDVNASVAREKAMTAANRQAFELILKKITTPAAVAQMMTLNDNQILNFVKEVSVLSEKASNVRYIAELRVKLNEKIVKNYIQDKGYPFMVDAAAEVLAVPVFRSSYGSQAMLWEDENLWKHAWEKNGKSFGMVEFSVISSKDEGYIDAGKALSLDMQALGMLARENRVSEVFVIEATGEGSDALSIKIYSPSGEGGVVESVEVYGQSGEALFDAAVEKVKSRIAARIRQKTVSENQHPSEITVLFMYRNLKDWLEAQKQLRDIPAVKKIQEEAIGDGRSQFKLNFTGSFDRLNQALQSKLFHLRDYGNFYVLETGYQG